MKEYYDFSKGRKNPHASTIKKEGYSVTEHYSPEDIVGNKFDDTKDIIQALVELMSVSDSKRLLAHIKKNYELPCTADVWDGIEENDLVPDYFTTPSVNIPRYKI